MAVEPRWIQPLPCPQEEAERTAAPPAPAPEDPCRGASPRRRAILRSCPSITARSGSDGWFALKRLAGVVLKWVVRTPCSFWIVTYQAGVFGKCSLNVALQKLSLARVGPCSLECCALLRLWSLQGPEAARPLPHLEKRHIPWALSCPGEAVAPWLRTNAPCGVLFCSQPGVRAATADPLLQVPSPLCFLKPLPEQQGSCLCLFGFAVAQCSLHCLWVFTHLIDLLSPSAWFCRLVGATPAFVLGWHVIQRSL